MSENYIIEMRNIRKEFPGIIANDNITLGLKKGEIHALLGENGAGKSTLMSILFGLYQPDQGSIFYNGKEVKIRNPNDATALKIGMVHQHFKLVEVFTVLDNIILGAEDSKFGFVTKKAARKKVEDLMEKYHLHVDLDKRIDEISVGMQQRTEILKMLYRDCEILIFDEPTAVLTPQEIDELIKIIKNMAKEGKSILFISHKLNEIMSVSDVCTVLRKGKYIGTIKTSETTTTELAKMMVGRNVSFKVDKTKANPKEVIFKVKNLCVLDKTTKKNVVNNVSFEVRKGEIVAIAGIDGNGQSELVKAITGLDHSTSGTIEFNGVDITKKSIKERIELGMSHIPEDRHKHGLVLDFNLSENFVIQRYRNDEFSNLRRIFINFAARDKYAERLIDEYDVRSAEGISTITRSMSGGNQQKAIVARELDRPHNFLLAVQPTRGLDVGAIESIHKKIIKDRDNGYGVLLVSLELDEVLNLADTIYVIYDGELVGKFENDNIAPEELGLYMAGGKRMDLEENKEAI